MTEQELDKAYLHWMYQAVGMGNHRLFGILRSIGPPQEVYGMARKELLSDKLGGRYKVRAKRVEASAASYDVAAEYEKMIGRGISFVAVGDEEYPKKLANIPDAPGALYYIGKLPGSDEKSIAVIGARNCSEYGRTMARQFGGMLAGAGVQVISGMARGIDGIAQQAALEADGYSLGVLGCGVDICYPQENRQLYERLIAQGGICSEYPPGTPPRAVLFPPRNRIISGLCDGVLVIEAKERSGTLITVDMALEQGREVYALPGRTTDPLSRGCNRLIMQGAGLVISPQELLRELKPGYAGTIIYEQQTLPMQQGVRAQLLQLLDYQPISMAVIQQKYADTYGDHITIPELCRELLQLCADGAAGLIGGSYYIKNC